MRRLHHEPNKRTWQSFLLITAMIMCLGPLSLAQSFQSFHIGREDGLPSSEVLDIAQAPDGTVWFVTRHGLAGFDGSEWQYINELRSGTPSILPRKIVIDEKGRFWLTSYRTPTRVGYFEDGRFQLIPEPPLIDLKEPSPGAVDLHVEAMTRRLLLTHQGTLHAWQDSSWTPITDSQGNPHRDISSMTAGDGELVIATGDSIESLEEGELQTHSLGISGLPSSPIAMARQESGRAVGRLWLVGEDWIGYWEHDEFELVEARAPRMSAEAGIGFTILPDQRGGLFIGSWHVLFHFDPDTGITRTLDEEGGFVTTGVTAMILDQDRNYWLSSLRGVHRIPLPIFANYDNSTGLLEDEVSALLELSDGRVVAGHHSGLSFLGSSGIDTLKFGVPKELATPVTRVMELHLTSSGDLLFPTSELGVGRFSSSGELGWLSGDGNMNVSSLAVVNEEVWWTSFSIYRSRLNGSELVTSHSPELSSIRRIQTEESGNVFALSYGLGVFWLDEGDWQNARGESVTSNDAYCAKTLSSGEVLVGTRAGLYTITEGRLVPRTSEFEILEPLYAILEDRQGRLWFGTRHGLLRWDGETLRTYGLVDGLLGEEVNRAALLEDSKGHIWVGSDGGLSRYIEENDLPPLLPEVRILQVVSDRKVLDLDESLQLSHSADLEVTFRAISFAGDATPRYRARLLGYEEEWLPESALSNGRIRYTNLQAGEYQFEVQARMRNSSWGPRAQTAAFTVQAPYWRRWWFVALLFLSTAIIVGSGTALASAHRNSNRLERLVAARTNELEDTERRYHEMFERNPAIQLLLDPVTTEIIDANRAASEFFDAPIGDLLGMTFADVTGWDASDFRLELDDVAKEGDEAVIRQRKLEGRLTPALEIRLGHYELRGQAVVQATIDNIEARLRLEEELLKSQKLRAIGLLAGGVAHDFNNLLAAILGHGELISIDCKGDEVILGHVDHIRHAGERGADLVKQLLAFGGRQSLKEEVLDLNSIIQEITEILQRTLGSRIEVVLDLADSACPVLVDRGQFERVLLNLVVNARDAMPDGGLLELKTRRVTKSELPTALQDSGSPGPFACVVIRDTGSGMTAEQRAQIFEPFFTTKAMGDGSGLGLSIVHGVVGQSGGTIDVISAPGEGTSVRIYWPLARESAKANQAPPAAEDVAPVETAKTVLVIDDDRQVRRAASLMLGSLGHRTLEAHDGKSAADLHRRLAAEIDLVLSDIRMPGESGWEVAQNLRDLDPDLPIILMSGFDRDSEGARGFPFLAKPFSADELGETIRKALEASFGQS